jgi:hypothetical protein
MAALRWRPTWIEAPEKPDWIAIDGDFVVGRIMLYEHGPSQGLWSWSITGIILPAGTGGGTAATAKEAARALRDAWRNRSDDVKAVGLWAAVPAKS